MTNSSDIRKASVAGMFYPANKVSLTREIEQLLSMTETSPLSGDVVALISPHAGYKYSGVTAAYGFKLLAHQTFDCIVIVAPSHREYFEGISIYSGEGYETPLGTLPVDDTLRSELLHHCKFIEASHRGHGAEHSIEVQLPFIQHLWGNVSILPVIMGSQRREYCFALGEALAKILGSRKTLMIASSDLSHYYPYETANQMDKRCIEDIQQCDYEKLMTDLETNHVEACGGGPAVAVLLASQKLKANQVQILHHCNSGDITGEHRSVVGYCSAAIMQSHKR